MSKHILSCLSPLPVHFFESYPSWVKKYLSLHLPSLHLKGSLFQEGSWIDPAPFPTPWWSVKWNEVKLLSRVQLFVTPRTIAYQASQSMGFSRQEYWSGLPFPSPGDLPNPGIEPGSPALQADALPTEPPGKPLWWSVPATRNTIWERSFMETNSESRICVHIFLWTHFGMGKIWTTGLCSWSSLRMADFPSTVVLICTNPSALSPKFLSDLQSKYDHRELVWDG